MIPRLYVTYRESSRDDLTSMGDGIPFSFEFEDWFKVDRRKLELLMQGKSYTFKAI